MRRKGRWTIIGKRKLPDAGGQILAQARLLSGRVKGTLITVRFRDGEEYVYEDGERLLSKYSPTAWGGTSDTRI